MDSDVSCLHSKTNITNLQQTYKGTIIVTPIKIYYGKDSKKDCQKKTGTSKKNKSGVKKSLVNHINARKKKGISRSKKNSTISKKELRGYGAPLEQGKEINKLTQYDFFQANLLPNQVI